MNVINFINVSSLRSLSISEVAAIRRSISMHLIFLRKAMITSVQSLKLIQHQYFKKILKKFVNYERNSSPKSMPKVCKTIHKQYEQQFQLKVTKFKRSLTFNVI
ncbi:hypothetical protein T4D_12926 [Trichinella pseudospiralis]|uniref:Uncharacterized protein n=1 Tax=Trichinella pseudospiralis TaxID=6337 RepID=A0A0V1G5X7_TRIPS|nr:hypothetical protein T4D_12926 [Trichinella pseudospiralis]